MDIQKFGISEELTSEKNNNAYEDQKEDNQSSILLKTQQDMFATDRFQTKLMSQADSNQNMMEEIAGTHDSSIGSQIKGKTTLDVLKGTDNLMAQTIVNNVKNLYSNEALNERHPRTASKKK